MTSELPPPQPAVFAMFRMLDTTRQLSGVSWLDFEILYEALARLRYGGVGLGSCA